MLYYFMPDLSNAGYRQWFQSPSHWA